MGLNSFGAHRPHQRKTRDHTVMLPSRRRIACILSAWITPGKCLRGDSKMSFENGRGTASPFRIRCHEKRARALKRLDWDSDVRFKR